MDLLAPDLVAGLRMHFPFASACLLPSLEYIDSMYGEGGALRHRYYGALVRLVRSGGFETRRGLTYWAEYEQQFRQAARILGIASPAKFRDAFEFGTAAAHGHCGPLGDIMAEVLYAIDLADHGFAYLRKLPRCRKRKRSDFLGQLGGLSFAIEVKAILSFLTTIPHLMPGYSHGHSPA